jgi:hypothetical protein
MPKRKQTLSPEATRRMNAPKSKAQKRLLGKNKATTKKPAASKKEALHKPLAKFNPRLKSAAGIKMPRVSTDSPGSSTAITIYGPSTLVSTKDSAGLPVAFYAVVNPPGGTFDWGYDPLDTAIHLVGPTNQSSVQVQALQDKSSDKPGDQIIRCDYTYNDSQGNPVTVEASFNITVARPASLKTIDPGTTKLRGNIVRRWITYQICDQFTHSLTPVYSFTNENGKNISVRVANLLVGEDLIYVEGPPNTHTPTNNGVVPDSGQFTDEISLTFPHDWKIDQWWYCHITNWTSNGEDTGNLVRTNVITVDSGTPEIVITQVH